MNFKNMKIPVENNLDEIVGELERLGYLYNCGCDDNKAKMVVARSHNMQYDIYDDWIGSGFKATLAEIKEM